jgi:hypothetical protein
MSVAPGTDVSNLPLSTVPGQSVEPPAPPTLPTGAAALPQGGTSLVDRLNIQPLDLTGALQILLAEVRAELVQSGLGAAGPALAPAVNVPAEFAASPGPALAPPLVLQQFLQMLPEDAAGANVDASVWLAAVSQLEAAIPVALDRAVAAVAGWRDVSPTVVAEVAAARLEILAALLDEPPNPLWLRPEWLGLAPRMERFRHRRRLARRALRDPDFEARQRAEGEEPVVTAQGQGER